MDLHKILKIVAIILSVIGAGLALVIISGDEATAINMSGNMLMVAYVILAIVLILVLIYVIKGLFSGNIKKTLMSVGAFIAVILISYVLSSGTDLDLTPFNSKGLGITEAISKNVGAGLIAFYILGFLAIASMVFSGFKKISK
ncbi:hypothetical protein [Confluentibacter flavum]|uniref:Uncharacterized protein n=1 Tax=Confluentibacter flavum TaxID=1909700 RepID=A0A2N3HPA7_9FLAO|nr:hypothetical protein [Confluentibacter flavum]PKQ46823.1 hypothetical protein CSW08_00485 [Confluentibacter flavum]